MDIKDIIDEAIMDEIKDRDKYRSLAVKLDNRGYHREAGIVSGMADDEDGHANLLMTLASSVLILPEEEPQGGRPVPQTYGDWNNLGEDIKRTAGVDDFKTRAEVNEHLYHISKEDEDPETAQVSKRWLTQKAGELGVT